MAVATVNGVRLYYEERGTGTPILGIHGAGSSAIFWQDAAERLSALGRVIVYDRRGCSRSERPEPYETTSVREHAIDARELLRTLDAAPAVLIGRSLGATIALDVALGHPESVLGLALLEGGPEGLSLEADAWFASLRDRLEALAAAGRVEEAGEVVIRDVLGAWEELPEAFRETFTNNSPALLAEVRGGERVDTARLATLRVPALVVTAEDSPSFIQSGSHALGQALPDARTVHVPGGHVIDPAGPEVLAFVGELIAR